MALAQQKYDHTAASMIGLLKYGSGLPFNRLQRLQGNCEIPLAASTQWGIVYAAALLIAAAYEELIRQAAQGEVVYNDDTTVKILELMGERAKKSPPPDDPHEDGSTRTGHVHFGRRANAKASGSRFLQRTPACGRKPERCLGTSRRGIGSADSNV